MVNSVALADWDSNISETAKKIGDSPFQRVILCVEDRHVLFRQDNVHEAIDLLHDQNLVVHINPWGITGFAGESVSRPGPFQAWLVFAATTDADSIMLDEPQSIKLGVNSSELVATVRTFTDKSLHLATEPENLDKIQFVSDFEHISASTYLFGSNMEHATPTSLDQAIDNWWDQGVDWVNSVWVQNWGIPKGKEWVPAELIKLWRGAGKPVNIWAWDAFRTVSSKRPANPDLVWEKTLRALEN